MPKASWDLDHFTASGAADPAQYIIFVDESGDPVLDKVDPQYPIFVLSLCLIEKSKYRTVVTPALNKLKRDYLAGEGVILHEREISKARPPFECLRDPALRLRFMTEVGSIIRALPFALVTAVVRKDLHAAQYSTPDSPYHLAMCFGLERMHMELQSRGVSGPTRVICECRGRKEDRDLELEFLRICTGANHRRHQFPFVLEMRAKAENILGLQLADLIARPVGRHVLNPAQPNAAYDIIKTKFRRSWSGAISGYGLKVFP